MALVTGYLVLMDMMPFCTTCAPTREDAQRLWGAEPSSPVVDLVRVSEIDVDFARRHELHCSECERALWVDDPA